MHVREQVKKRPSNRATSRQTMSSQVTKSLPFLVGPSEPTPAGTIEITSMDCALASLPMALLLVFEQPIPQPAETIRKALSRSLLPYYPVAGRLTAGARIACTGEGVAFMGASASCSLQDARLTDPHPAVTVEDLTGTYCSGHNQDPPPPLLLMQVTEFSCGGFVVGVTWDHVVADAAGMAQFLQAVGELARGFSSPSVEPVRVDRTLPQLLPPIVAMTKSLVSSKHNDYPCSYITVPMSFINRIKDEFRFRRQQDQPPAASWSSSCTAFDVFTAALWKCRCRATMAAGRDAAAPTALAFAVDVRKPAGARAGYYGNVVSFGVAPATLGEVADADVLDLVMLVKDAKARVPSTLVVDGAARVGGDKAGGRLRGLDGYDILYVTSWWNLGFDGVDFGGGGGPACFVGNMERRVAPFCILCGRKDRADGVAAMAFCVKPEHAQAFHQELKTLTK